MDLTEDQIIEKYAKHCNHRNRNTLFPKKMNLLVFHVATILLNGNTNSLK